MLVLSRKISEAVMIGEDIEIRVIAIEGDQIKLGIDAPKSVEIYRKEIYLSIQAENNEAASISEDMIQLLKTYDKKL